MKCMDMKGQKFQPQKYGILVDLRRNILDEYRNTLELIVNLFSLIKI